MRSFKYISVFAVAISSLALFGQGYNSNIGRGGIAITPRGFSFKTTPSSVFVTPDSFSVTSETRAIQLEKAKNILQNTNIITSPKIGEGGAISEQTLAFASIRHYRNKSTAKLNAQMVFNFAKTNEGHVYALMLIYLLFSKTDYELAAKQIDFNREVNTLFGGKFRRMKISEFFEGFFRDPALFIPTTDILNISTSTNIYYTVPIFPNPPPPIIINRFRPSHHHPPTHHPPPPPPRR